MADDNGFEFPDQIDNEADDYAQYDGETITVILFLIIFTIILFTIYFIFIKIYYQKY